MNIDSVTFMLCHRLRNGGIYLTNQCPHAISRINSCAGLSLCVVSIDRCIR